MIPATTVANKPGTPGRVRISRKPIAQGRPVVRAATCGSAACFFLHADHGCDQHPAFPAPSHYRGWTIGKARTQTRRENKDCWLRNCERGLDDKSTAVMPAKAGIQYTAASRSIAAGSGILDDPPARMTTSRVRLDAEDTTSVALIYPQPRA